MQSEHSQHLDAAIEQAIDAFWQVIVEQYPTAKYGDLSPLTHLAFHEAARNAVTEWINNNFPDLNTLATGADGDDPITKRYRVHVRELGYYQASVEATSAAEAVELARDCPPELTFIATEDRDVFGIDELQTDKTWKQLPDGVINDA
jgi:hypothetical protein